MIPEVKQWHPALRSEVKNEKRKKYRVDILKQEMSKGTKELTTSGHVVSSTLVDQDAVSERAEALGDAGQG